MLVVNGKRYWVFAGSNYYPPKGMVGFKGSFENEHDAEALMEHCINSYHDWAHIYDSEDHRIVKAFDLVNMDVLEKLPQAIEEVWLNPQNSPEWDSELFEARRLLDNEGKFE